MEKFPVFKIQLIKEGNIIDMYLPYGALNDNFLISMLSTGVKVLVVGRSFINPKDIAL